VSGEVAVGLSIFASLTVGSMRHCVTVPVRSVVQRDDATNKFCPFPLFSLSSFPRPTRRQPTTRPRTTIGIPSLRSTVDSQTMSAPPLDFTLPIPGYQDTGTREKVSYNQDFAIRSISSKLELLHLNSSSFGPCWSCTRTADTVLSPSFRSGLN
jgi:hypothetical protein